ncbi:hypothetical protein N7475_003578 [Penicillium sp. IBT 31633x]|nr:hypothetical protein N7475_003578 [Penicillium sp. IBT 31633x]
MRHFSCPPPPLAVVLVTLRVWKTGLPVRSAVLKPTDLLNQSYEMPFPLKQRQNFVSLGVNN